MRLSCVISPLLFAWLTVSQSFGLFGTSQTPLDDDKKIPVPGKNPLVFCSDPTDYILKIDYVDLDPPVPVAGGKLSIKANGTFSKDVEAGAKVYLEVKYGVITLIRQRADLCDQIGNVDLTCPLKKGPMNITREATIPENVPKGKYTVLANVTSVDEEVVTCMEGVAYF